MAAAPVGTMQKMSQQDEAQLLENAWDNMVAEWAAKGLRPPPKMAPRAAGAPPMTAEEEAQEKTWAMQREQLAAAERAALAAAGKGSPAGAEKKMAGEAGEESVDYSGRGVTDARTLKKMAMKMPAGYSGQVAASTNSTIDIRPITIAVNNLNTTINKVLTAIESRLKKNDVNSQLKKMTEFISQINDSLPVQGGGGGTRRANMKKRKKTLRRYRY